MAHGGTACWTDALRATCGLTAWARPWPWQWHPGGAATCGGQRLVMNAASSERMAAQSIHLVPVDHRGGGASWDHPSTVTGATASSMYTGTLGGSGTTTQVSATSPPLSPDAQLSWLRLRQRGPRTGSHPGHYSPGGRSSPTKLVPMVRQPALEAQDARARRPGQGMAYFLSADSSQDSRSTIRTAITAADADATIVESHELVADRAADLHPAGTPGTEIWRDDAHVRLVLAERVAAAAAADVFVLHLPSAEVSSSAALELHVARAAGKMILAVAAESRARDDWVLRSYSDRIFQTTAELSAYLQEQQSGKDWKGLRRDWRPARRAHAV